MQDFTKIELFYDFLNKDPKSLNFLKSQAKKYSNSGRKFLEKEVIPFAKKHDFDIKIEELIDYEHHLHSSPKMMDDDELKNVAGGANFRDISKGLAVFALSGGMMLGLGTTASHTFATGASINNSEASVSQKSLSQAQELKILSVTTNKIVIETSPDFEYNISCENSKGVPWQRPFQDSGVFENLEDFTEYKIQTRDKKTLKISDKPIIVKTFINPEKIKLVNCFYNSIYVSSPRMVFM